MSEEIEETIKHLKRQIQALQYRVGPRVEIGARAEVFVDIPYCDCLPYDHDRSIGTWTGGTRAVVYATELHDGEWWIRLNVNGTTGWVHEDFVNPVREVMEAHVDGRHQVQIVKGG